MSEALRLVTTPGAVIPVDIETTAMLAAELRRLHEENEAFKNRLAQAIEQMPFGDTAASFAAFVRNFK